VQSGSNVSQFAWVRLNSLDSNTCGSGRCSIVTTAGRNLFEYAANRWAVYGYQFSPVTWVYINPSPALKVNRWYHVGFTYNGTSLRFYQDGVDIGGNNNVPGTMSCAGDIYMGSGNERYFNGWIDEVRSYSRTLSSAEVKQLYAMGGDKIQASTVNKGGSLTSGLVGHWTFDGTDISGTQVYDKSGQNNTGTSSGGVTKVMGKLGQGMKFNGVNGKVTATGYETATFTLGAWVKTGDTREDKWFVEMTDGSGNRHGIGMYPAGKPVITYGVAKYKCSTGSVINDSKWHYFIGTYDGTGAKIYIDGVSQNLSTELTTGTKTPNTLTIGSTSSGGYVNSLIDDARVWNRALSAAEVKQLYNMGR